ncbi:MAG TPA: carboxypeptidase regulatory-like domain-containing protein [Candidatus Marinimicrobia bacterium]|nr:carboxypeptidase regulatory-like domain-containing protein [Candidatus Neomarinimicrobiota bacterium]
MQKMIPILLCFILLWMGCNLLDAADEAIVDVSGKVTDNGSAVEGAIVLLIESAEISDGLNLSNGSITNSRGNYTILKVDPGKYYVVAIDDENNNLEFDTDTDRLGFYGVNRNTNDLEPDRITVDDDDLKNIDITDLYSLSGK